jgi:preprotein translocase subunit SecA
MFREMSYRIKEETVRNLFLVKIAGQDDLEELAPPKEQEMLMSRGESEGGDSRQKTVRRQADKVGRNDPCPCGSGKKYKKCCGKAA